MIYVNNAATTWPKPEGVYQQINSYMKDFGYNPSRSGGVGISRVEREIFNVRTKVAKLINASNSSRVIFTSGATEALNLAIKGVLRKGDHVITTELEHNSVLCPLRKLEKSKLIEGGTGSDSLSTYQPAILPDRYEAGTLNTMGIIGLGAGIDFVLETGITQIRGSELRLTKRFIAGLYCAPLLHQALHTKEIGMVRVSFSYFNTEEEVDIILEALFNINMRNSLILYRWEMDSIF